MTEQSRRVYYHITFSPHKRIGALWDEIEEEFYAAAKEAANRYRFSIVAMSAMPDHVHVLVEIAPWDRIPDIVNLLKGTSSRRIGQRFPELKLDMRSNHFWSAGYRYKRHDDLTLPMVINYIQNQKRKAGLEE